MSETGIDMPADVRAAEASCIRADVLAVLDVLHPNWRRWPAPTRLNAVNQIAEALAASDAVRLAGAGDVVERLRAICGPSMQQCQCRSDQADCVACTCGRAATLITTLRADNVRLAGERGAAREGALREAAQCVHRVMEWAINSREVAAAILALALPLPTDKEPGA